MTARACLLVLALVVGGLLPATAAESALPRAFFRNLHAGKAQTVVTYGTSLTDAGAWVDMLQAWFDQRHPGLVTVVNSAKSGQNSAWGLANVQEQVVARRPDLVFVEFAINDAVRRFSITTQQSRTNLDGILAAIRTGNPRVEFVLMTMNAAIDADGKSNGANRPRLADYYAGYRACATAQKLPFIDNYPAWRALAERDPQVFLSYAPDGLHPNAAGLAAVTWPNIEALLQAADRTAAGAGSRR